MRPAGELAEEASPQADPRSPAAASQQPRPWWRRRSLVAVAACVLLAGLLTLVVLAVSDGSDAGSPTAREFQAAYEELRRTEPPECARRTLDCLVDVSRKEANAIATFDQRVRDLDVPADAADELTALHDVAVQVVVALDRLGATTSAREYNRVARETSVFGLLGDLNARISATRDALRRAG